MAAGEAGLYNLSAARIAEGSLVAVETEGEHPLVRLWIAC